MTFRSLAVLSALVALPATAQRVSFPSFTGPGANTVRNQLVTTACDSLDCVPATQTTTKGKPDWKKAKKEAVQYFVTGAVVKKGKALTLDLAIFNKAGKPRSKKSFPLDKAGTLSAKNLQAAMELMGVNFESKAPPPPPKEEKTPPIEPAKEPVAKKTPLSDPPPPQDPVEEPQPKEPIERGTSRKKPAGEKARFLVVDVGLDVLNRRLEYSQVATANLRRYDLPAFAAATVGAQFYPLALTGRDDLLAGLGVEFALSFAPWLQSRLISTPEPFPTSAIRIDGGARWNLTPVKSFPFTVSPYAGVRSQSFTVSALSDGRRIDGLPNIGYVGFRFGLGVELPVVPRVLSVFGRFGLVPGFGGGEILSAAFFPNGSAFGLETNAGIAVRIVVVEVRAAFEYSHWGLTFTTQPTDTYVAAGASDRYLGGNVSLRFAF